MSAILGFAGNIYDAVVTNEQYVTYRLTDPSLNIGNYEPMYAARWVEPTEIAIAPRMLSSFVFPPVRTPAAQPVPSPAGPKNLPGPPPPSQPLTPTIIVDDPVDASLDPGTPVPEPGYSLVIGMLLVVLYVRFARLGARTSS